MVILGIARPDNGETACDIRAFELVEQTPFVSFGGKLEISRDGFDLNSKFTLGTGSRGINPVRQDVTLQIGPYCVTVAARSFKRNKKGAYKFERTVGGVSLELRINPVGGNSYTLQAEGEGRILRVSGIRLR